MSHEELLNASIGGKSGSNDQVNQWDQFRGRLIPQSVVRALRGGVSNMTIFRHVRKKIIPPPIVIDGRNYWILGEILDANEADSKRRK